MILTVDIGNTNVSCAIFDKGSVIKYFNFATNIYYGVNTYKQLFNAIAPDVCLDNCIIASVVEGMDNVLKQACDECFNLNSMIVDQKMLNCLKIDVEEPEKVGIDRIINTHTSKLKYPYPAIIIDIGTAITFDILSKDGNFIGGMIMPGVGLQLKALNEFTSKLPLIEAGETKNIIGKTTEDAILSGVVLGVAAAVDGLIEKAEDEYGEKLVVVATGGHAELISKYSIRGFDFINPKLTLEGLRMIYEMYSKYQ